MPRAAVMANQRGRILEATIAALAEHGYAGVRVSDIAERRRDRRGARFCR
jgi:AcrR family transcriptional regulator